jgi:uncharacterized membrane protein
MTRIAFAKLYAVTAPILFAIDLVWLGIVAKDFYRCAAALGAAVAAASYRLASWVL